MGIKQLPGRGESGANSGKGCGLVGLARGESLGDRRVHGGRQGEAAGLLQCRHQLTYDARVASRHIEEQAFEVAGHFDIHRGTHGRRDAGYLIAASGNDAVQYVVGVGGDNETFDGHSELPCEVARKYISKVAGGHAEINGTIGSAKA